LKTEPRTPEQAEWLQHYESALAESPAVMGFMVLDEQGGMLAEKSHDLPEGANLENAATWVQNAFHAVESYYPASNEIFLRYRDYNIALCRKHELIAVAVLDPSYELKTFTDLLSGERLKRLASRLRTGNAGGGAKKSETVFLKISDEGTPPPPAGEAPAATPVAAPVGIQPRKSPLLLILVALAVLLVAGVVAFFALGGTDDTPASAPAPQAAPVDYEAETNRLRLEATELGQLARDLDANAQNVAPQLYASGYSSAQAAQRAGSSGDFREAVSLWTDARDAYGQAALQAARLQLERAQIALAVTQPRNYAKATWTEVDRLIAEAETAEEAQNYRSAITLTRQAASTLEQMPAGLKGEIRSLARGAADANDTATAETFYRDLLRLEPQDAEATAFIYRYSYQPGETFANGVGMDLAFVPAGTFTMGSPADEANREPDEVMHEVTLTQPFFMATTEVTQAQWHEVMGRPLALADAEDGFVGPDLPVHSIGWEQARAFARKLSEREGRTYRLPTEAEWEYAARAGSSAPYATGASLSGDQAQVYDADQPAPVESPTAVASFAPNAWGLYDMHGNVWEWTADWFGPYSAGAATDPKGASEDSFSRIDLALKALRGGSWYDEADKARSANRWGSSPSAGANYIGFRVVMDVPVYAPVAE